MKIIKRIFIKNDIKQLLDAIVDTDDYHKSLDRENGNEDAVVKALDKDLIEEYMQSSGIIVGDTHFKHEAYRLTEKGKLYAASKSEKVEFKRYKGNTYVWLAGVLSAVIAGLILYAIGVGR